MSYRSIVLFVCAALAAGCTDDAYEDRAVAQDASAPSATAPASSATPTPEAAAPEAAQPADTALPSTVASATGRVDRIDPVAGSITIAHGPVESLGWPAMTMAFKATPEQIAAVKAGDDVTFVFDTAGNEATLVSITAAESNASDDAEAD
jgi:Cu(I)/Ag(I) efflux system protein CusF